MGHGTPVVLVRGSLATGADEWQAQRPLADTGFRLLVLDRRGYGRSPMVQGEDSYVMRTTSPSSMGDGAHLVGHSYGGLGVLVVAARRAIFTDILDFCARVLAIQGGKGRSLNSESDPGHGSAPLLVGPRAVRFSQRRLEAHECARPVVGTVVGPGVMRPR